MADHSSDGHRSTKDALLSSPRKTPNRKDRVQPEGKQTQKQAAGKKIESVQGEQSNMKKQQQGNQDNAWPILKFSESSGKSTSLPPVFSEDGVFCFVATGSAIKVYSVATGQLLSSLNAPAVRQQKDGGQSTTGARKSTADQSIQTITSVFLNSTNRLQLITTSLDGFIRVWDFLEGKILRNIDLGHAIILACQGGFKDTSAQENSVESVKVESESIFVALAKPGSRMEGKLSTVIYQVSLKRRGDKKVRLGKAKARAMALSNDKNHLVVVGSRKICIFLLPSSSLYRSGTENVIKFNGIEENHKVNYEQGRFTCLAVHPTEGYFATGDDLGRIKFWYLLEESALRKVRNSLGSQGEKAGSVPRKASSTVHWHAHAVASIQFTPNGAYLLSGGEEATLVAWQMASSGKHKEFIPRLGAPIATVGVTVGQGKEQEFVARLTDGSIVFVGAGSLKIVRSIATVKTLNKAEHLQNNAGTPLAIEPWTQNLVLQGSQPSSVQFFSPRLNTHVYELDISPGNRVSRIDDRRAESAAVQHIAFARRASPSQSSSTSTVVDNTMWMATFDTWQDRNYSRESHLKIWLGHSSESYNSSKSGYALNSRIDNPHGNKVLTSMTFTPSASSGSPYSSQDPLLVTTSQDGQIKVWAHHPSNDPHIQPAGIWLCKFDLSYRSQEAFSASISQDNSLLVVGHDSCVSLWNIQTGTLLTVLVVSKEDARGSVKRCEFLSDGMRIVAITDKGSIVWDTVGCEEILSFAEPTAHLAASHHAPAFTSVFQSSLTQYNIQPSLERTHHTLSFRPSEFLEYLPAQTTSSGMLDTTSGVYAATSRKGELLMTSNSQDRLYAVGASGIMDTMGPTSLKTFASSAAAMSGAVDGRPIRLFEDIFGENRKARRFANKASAEPVFPYNKGKATNAFDENPPHALPPLASLWRELVSGELKELPKRFLQVDDVQGDEGEDMDIDDENEKAPNSQKRVELVDSPDILAKIFAQTVKLSAFTATPTPNKSASEKQTDSVKRASHSKSKRKSLS